MKTLCRVILRGCAVVLAYASLTAANVTLSAACENNHKCSTTGDDYCWTNGSTQGSHCHINHGVCSQGSGSCEAEA
jgi:hypothetical protein